ncbi:hypothetical protein [Vibrio parahaemolyticus]|uniref:hypothetical protein n=1 Tax=Vibrio parahaemolyticus TaxID=670 RepID=UPI0006981739|nr:hypothetical protein [Vibrio parahaemolyticus]
MQHQQYELWVSNRVQRLESRIAELEAERDYLRNEILEPQKPLPERVRQWMRDYSTPIWELFYCFEHGQWYVELDNTFPYHLHGCKCDKCKESKI